MKIQRIFLVNTMFVIDHLLFGGSSPYFPMLGQLSGGFMIKALDLGVRRLGLGLVSFCF